MIWSLERYLQLPKERCDMRVVLSNYAWVSMSELGPQAMKIAEELTVFPRAFSDYNKEPPAPIYAFKEERGLMGLPREWFLSNAKMAHDYECCYSNGTPVIFHDTIVSREGQAELVDKVMRHYNQDGGLGAIICAGTGLGKTIMGLKIACMLGTTTLVVVHTELLRDHWLEKIREFVPKTKVGLVQGDSEDWRGKHIVVAMLQSLLAKEMPEEFYRHYGFCIFDECHHVGAAVWNKVVPQFYAKHRLGLTATLKRADGTDAIVYWHLGKVFTATVSRNLEKPKIQLINSKMQLVRTRDFDPERLNKSVLIRFLSANKQRNALIVGLIIKALLRGRKVMVLSHRIDHLVRLATMFREHKPANLKVSISFLVSNKSLRERGLATRNRTRRDLEKAKGADLMLCSYAFAAEGVDIPELDTLFMATPIGNVVQAVGRILREHPDKKPPVVVDIVDRKIRRLERAAEHRVKIYNQQGWVVLCSPEERQSTPGEKRR